jgi:hypothetical protein
LAGTIAGVATVFISIAALDYQRQEAYDKSRDKQVDMALEKLSATFAPARELLGDYIPREQAEADLRNYVGADGATAAAGAKVWLHRSYGAQGLRQIDCHTPFAGRRRANGRAARQCLEQGCTAQHQEAGCPSAGRLQR